MAVLVLSAVIIRKKEKTDIKNDTNNVYLKAFIILKLVVCFLLQIIEQLLLFQYVITLKSASLGIFFCVVKIL